jgi:hypothetical protein
MAKAIDDMCEFLCGKTIDGRIAPGVVTDDGQVFGILG